MTADKLAKNIPNAPNFICLNCLPKKKVLDFAAKSLHWASVVRDKVHMYCKLEKLINCKN